MTHPPTNDDVLIAFHSAGVQMKTLERMFGMCSKTIRKHIKEGGGNPLRSRPPVRHGPLFHIDDEKLIEMYKSGVELSTIYSKLGVKPNKGRYRRWTPEEEAILVATRRTGATGRDYEGCVPDRSYDAIMVHMKTMPRGRFR